MNDKEYNELDFSQKSHWTSQWNAVLVIDQLTQD